MSNEKLEEIKSQIHDAFMAKNPMVLNSEIPDSITNKTETINFEPFINPVYTPEPQNQEQKPGIWEGIKHEWQKWSGLGSNIKAYEKAKALRPENSLYDNPSDDPIPDDWTPFHDREPYANVSREWWDTLSQAKSPKDLQARFNFARDQMAKDEYFEKGSIVQKIVSKSLGIPAGIVIDPYNLVPIAASMKYLRLSQNFISGAMKAAPALAAIEGTKELINYTEDPDLDFKEAGYNAIRDTLAGTLLIGGMAGLGRGWEGYKLYRVRQAANHNYEGIGAKFKLSDKGEITGYEAYVMDNTSLSAATQNRAQEFYDSAFKQGGLFWLPFVTKLAGLGSPIVRGLSDSWGTLPALTNRLVDHDIATIGGNKHVPDRMSFEKRMMFIEADAQAFGAKMEGLRKQYNGIDLTVDDEEALKSFNTTLNKRDPYNPASFGRRVASAIITDAKAEGKEINEAKHEWDIFAAKNWARYQNAMGFKEETLPIETAEGYMTQVYNRSQMVANTKGWVDITSQGLKVQDDLIRELKKPIEDIDELIKGVRQEILNGQDLQQNRTLLADLRAQRSVLRDELIKKLRDNPKDYGLLLRARNMLDSEQAKGLKQLLEPLNKFKRDLKKEKRKVAKFQKERNGLISRLESNKAEGIPNEVIQAEYKEIKAAIDEIDEKISLSKKEIENFESNIITEDVRLNSEAMAGNVPEAYFWKHHETGQIHFRNPNDLPKFRDVYEDDAERRLAAEAHYTSILNLSDEEIMSQKAATLNGIVREDPTYKRTIMLPSSLFLDNNFLVTDLPSIAHNYATGLGRASAMNEALRGFGISKNGIDGVYEVLGKEYQSKLAELDKLEGKEKLKKQNKLNKEFNKKKDFVRNLIDAMLGVRHDSPTIRKASADIRNLAASTRLGFVPLTQVSDMMGNVFKHGMWRFIRDGFLPSIQTMNGKLRTKAAENYRQTASEANLALEHFRAGMVKKFYGHDTYGDLVPSNPVSAFLQKAANFSGNLSGMNYIENFNQSLTAQIVQSKIMDYMHRATKGTLKKSQRSELDRLGIDPDVWAEQFVNQFETHGESGVFGGYQSYYYNWSNDAAKVKMANAINNGVRNTIIRRGRADAPFFVDNSVLSLVTQFMGWGFAAFNRYTVPLLQRFEANQIMGTALIAMVASMEGITRKIARGEEVDMDNENFMAEAFSNSAPFAMLYKSAMFANQFMDNDFLNSMQNDKQRSISQLGMIGGAGFGVLKDYARVLSMIGSNDYNKTDIAKAVRAIPGMQAWYLYRAQQAFIDAATEGLPERRAPKGS